MPRTRAPAPEVDPADERIRITLRVQRGIVDYFKAEASIYGGFYQVEIERALRDHVERHTGEPVEDRIAKLVRCEVRKQFAALEWRK